MDSGIYQITNQENGNRYVGSAVNLGHRWAVHLSALRHNTHHSPHLQAAFLKYGETAFAFAVLEWVEDSEQLIAREQHYLDTLKPAYNLCPIAGSPMLGRLHTPETRRLMSVAQSGTRHPNYGKHRSAETRRKISEAWTLERRKAESDRLREQPLLGGARKGEPSRFYGKHHSPEAKRQISATLKAYWRRVHGLIDAAV